MSELRLDGKVAIVTGGAVGIGHGISMKLAQRGAKVVVNGNHRPSGEGPEVEVAAEIRRLGGEAVAVNGSVTDDDATGRIVAKAIETWGRLDILVNNAGFSDGPNLPCGPDESFDAQIAVHVHGAMKMFRDAWPHLVAAGAGRVLNVGSMTFVGYEGPRGWNSGYATAKAAVTGLTRQMAGVARPHGVKVNLLLPRAITPLKMRRIAGTELLKWQEKHLAMEPLAASVVWLVHEDFPETGQYFSSAGGRIARVVVATPDGYFNPDLTPEDVRDNWDQVMGRQDAAGYVERMLELTDQDDEHQLLIRLYDGLNRPA